jgi:FMN phosphatase YigB (HAD superfamily)
MLSNTNELHYTHNICTVAVFPLFDAVTLSFEVKAMKPARPMYDDILEKLAVTPEECVYIDDLNENVITANFLGMRGILFMTPEKLVQDLQRMGVNLNTVSQENQ